MKTCPSHCSWSATHCSIESHIGLKVLVSFGGLGFFWVGFGSISVKVYVDDILLVDKSVSWESHSFFGTSLIESSDDCSFLVEAFDRSHDSKCKFHFAKIHVKI